VDNVLGDPDRADEIDAESVEGYAQRKGLKISNSTRRNTSMAKANETRSNAELLDTIADLKEENDALQDKLDVISDLASIDEDEDDEDDVNGDDDDDYDDSVADS
jgi:hypothetical protein